MTYDSYVINVGDLTLLTLGNVFCKYADDTYLVIPASNVDSRTREIENIRSWSCANNLNLNLKKSSEIVFVDSLRRRQIQLPSLFLKMLGITINNHFSVIEHVSCVIGKFAQIIQALRIPRSHGLCNDTLHLVYRSTVIGKLLYAVNVWWGFTSAADRQRLEALVKRGVRSGLCTADTPNLAELIESSDDGLYNRVLCHHDRILFTLLSDERDFTYNLKKNHNILLTIKQGRLCSCNFITRMLFKACY